MEYPKFFPNQYMKTKPDNYVKDRHIGRNTRLVKDIMELTSLDNISGGTIFFDLKKALDSED